MLRLLHRRRAAAHPPPEGSTRSGRAIRWVDDRLSSLDASAVERAGLATIIVLGVVDYLLPPELLFGISYLVPIALVAWYGRGWAGGFAATVAAFIWLAADWLGRPEPPLLHVATWNVLARFVGFVVVVWLVARLRGALDEQRDLAHLDPLTELKNTRAFFERLEQEIDLGLRYGRVFTLAYIDLDRFKEVNDTLGHAEGDEVLRRVARTMKETMRSSDLTARLGGDEFGIILPETPYAQAEGALEKLRNQVLEGMREKGWPVTLSIGAVTFEVPLANSKDALQLADRLMYEAKDSGPGNMRQMLWTGEADAPAP